jgi:hypothetical protein
MRNARDYEDHRRDAQARRAARSVGLQAMKSSRAESLDNLGDFMLVDINNCVVRGSRYDMSADDVIGFCGGKG